MIGFQNGRTSLLALVIAIGALVPAFAQSAKERIAEQGEVQVGVHNRAPWGFKDAQGNPAGWHPDIVSQAFAGAGLPGVEIKVAEFGALIPGLLARRFDVVASGLAITPERCTQVAFAEPDIRVPDAAIVLPGNPKNIHGYADIAKDETIVMGGGRGSVVAKRAEAAGVPKDRILLFPDIDSNLAALRAGRIHVVVLTSPTIIGLLENGATGIERATPFTTTEAEVNYAAVAFRKEDSELRDIFNAQLKRMKADGSLAALRAKYHFGDTEIVPDGITTKSLCGE